METKHTPTEDDLADLLSDAEASERQAKDGPFYPALGITSESLLAYAAKCRQEIDLIRAALAKASRR